MTIDPSIVGRAFPEFDVDFDRDDVVLYALGIGAGRTEDEARYVRGDDLETFPLYPVVTASKVFTSMTDVLEVDGTKRLHGEQRLTLHAPLPTAGRMHVSARAERVWDKGSGAVIDTVADFLIDGTLVATATFGSFIRDGGGFGGERGEGLARCAYDRAPDVTADDEMSWNQALLYSLTGDDNPLHTDPDFARRSGFDRPIAHGLCTLGFGARMGIVAAGLGSDIAEINCRFISPVYPGERLRLEAWRDGDALRGILYAGDRVAIDPLEIVTARSD